MPGSAPAVEAAKSDAALAACLLAVSPCAFGGVSLRAPAGPEREKFVSMLSGVLACPVRRLPLNISDDRLFGGLDLAATLQAKRPVHERGLLADASGGMLIVPTAERMPQGLASRLAVALDAGHIAILALDEGLDDDEAPPHALRDRLAIHLDMTSARDWPLEAPFSTADIEAARARLPAVRAGDDMARAICRVAVELGVTSMRAQIAAMNIARIHAALAGRRDVSESDIIMAARLVLLPRATRIPSQPEQAEPQQPETTEPSQASSSEEESADDGAGAQLADIVLEAVAASIPPGLLDRMRALASGRLQPQTSGRFGTQRNGGTRGRAIGTLRRPPSAGARLHLVETLRAAVPWQPLRRAEGLTANRVAIRREDFRTVRYRQRSGTATIFVVDASGSAAMHRLAEAKGAVELLLADCYIRRDQVALIAFRGAAAELILPPTRSLARAKRTLAALPGGGGTPLAAAIDAGHALADAMRRKGVFPTLVFLTDGRANIGRAPSGDRASAQQDAMAAAKTCRVARYVTIVVDTSPHPGPSAERLASEIGGLYLPLPHADAKTISQAVRRSTPGDRFAAPH